jgi:hypothetical protein
LTCLSPACLQFYSYSSAIAGMLKVKACATFNAKVVIMMDSGVEGSGNKVVACGSCAKPAV